MIKKILLVALLLPLLAYIDLYLVGYMTYYVGYLYTGLLLVHFILLKLVLIVDFLKRK